MNDTTNVNHAASASHKKKKSAKMSRRRRPTLSDVVDLTIDDSDDDDNGRVAKRVRKNPPSLPSMFPASLVFQNGNLVLCQENGEMDTTTASIQRYWLHHDAAATYCSHHYEPLNQYRRLGVISRTLTGNRPIPTCCRQEFRRVDPAYIRGTPPNIAIAAAKKIARQQALWAKEESRNEGQLLVDAQQIVNDWARIKKRGRVKPFWDEEGQIEASEVDLHDVYELLVDGTLKDQHENEQTSLYNGLVQVPMDTKSVLKAIMDLQEPHEAFWSVPLIACYGKVLNGQQLVLGIYASRLLFECMTHRTVQIIMAAMSPETVDIATPISYPPAGQPVFCPDGQGIVYERPDYDDSDNDEKDVTMQGSTCTDDNKLYAFSNAGFLKLCESLGNDVSEWPQLEQRLQGDLQVSLMLHQIHALCWMVQMERLETINSILWEERRFPDGVGSYYYSPALGQARLFLGDTKTTHLPPTTRIRGGVLGDEMGLGKTVEVLALILATRTELEDEEPRQRFESTSNHTTLIVVPPALVNQWLKEIRKITGDALVVEYFDHRYCHFHRRLGTQHTRKPADIVITTYSALEKKKKASSKHTREYTDASRILKARPWGRVVLDEMQEIRSATSAIASNCKGLLCSRRWMLSGTPLFEGIDDFRGELQFLGLEPFAANCDDGFFDFAIKNRWEAEDRECLETLRVLSLVMLRRSKSMTIRETGLPLLGLKPLSLLFQPIAQDTSERAVYCFMESLVHRFQKYKGSDDSIQHKALLGLLRQACVAPSLLALAKINFLMIECNRMELGEMEQPQEELSDSDDDSDDEGVARARSAALAPHRKPISCNAAIRFLSQVMEKVRVDGDFVSDVAMGTGQGISRRNRAIDLPEQQLVEAQEVHDAALETKTEHQSKRAKSNWFLLLEKVTTGQLPLRCYSRASPKFKSIWALRFLAIRLQPGEADRRSSRQVSRFWGFFRNRNQGSSRSDRPTRLPEVLARGWRPGTNFFHTEASRRAKRRWQWAKDQILFGHLPAKEYRTRNKQSRKIRAVWKWRFALSAIQPALVESLAPCNRTQKKHCRDLCLKSLHQKRPDFPWAHPHCFLLQGSPPGVTANDLRQAFLPCRADKTGDGIEIILEQRESAWNAYVQFKLKSDYDAASEMIKHAAGIQIPTAKRSVILEEELLRAEENKKRAEAECLVHESTENMKRRKECRKKFQLAKLGLRMLSSKHMCRGHVLCTPSILSLRDDSPRTSTALLSSCNAAVENAAEHISLVEVTLEQKAREITRFKTVIERGIDASLQAKSAFDTLQLLQEGKRDETQCMVCFEALGMGNNSGGIISLTPCGHLFCRGCMDGYFREKYAERRITSPPCMMCRKPVQEFQIKSVDPDSTSDDELVKSKRSAAQLLLEQAAELLKTSDGQLSAELWDAIYLTRDLPPASMCSHHPTHTAIPNHFLGHLRHAESFGYSSKVRALLEDLPRDELSVVFASSKEAVNLLLKALDESDFGCRGLFTGQRENESERAIEEWESLDDVSVLVVQSGAAACGLTLTAACKMFIMEPFMKHEEEKQAYARLHRYGQTKPVEVKIYYHPVSVESRLLEWRKRALNNVTTQEMITFGAMKTTGDDADDDDNEEDDEENQTRFLLGLQNKNASSSA